MSGLLIVTKLHIPQVRAGRVLRPRLVNRLQQGLDKRLILVSAPAGYGKTTLVSEWVASHRHSAWVSLNKDDNDPARFWGYVFSALQGVFASADRPWSDILTDFNQRPDEMLWTVLINTLEQWPHSLFLVLDDYHNINSQEIHEGVLFLLENAPPHLHLVIVTRADPPLSLAKLRARAGLLELRQADLCFTVQEASDFLSHTMGLQVTPEDVSRVTVRTEGWIAGLQMAALSMQNIEDISGFITTLTGTHHYIFDYLLDEILEQQSPEIRRFLLNTSILEQMTAPLCDALVSGKGQEPLFRSSAVILEELEHTNLFIQSLDHEQRWYRYHTLFADLLQGYLLRTNADRIPALHLIASDWFEEQGLISEAIHHALAAGQWERVVRLISINIFALLEQRALNMVIRQLDHLSGKEIRAEPWLLIGRAWLAAYTGQFATIATTLRKVEAELETIKENNQQQTLRGHCAGIRAFSAWVSGERHFAVQAAREALDYLPESDRTIRCQTATILGLSCDDLDERERAYTRAIEYAQGISVSHVVIFAYGCQAYLFFLKGRLHKAYATCKQAIQIANSSRTLQPLPSLSHVYSTLSEIHREWNDLDKAVYYAQEAVSLACRWEQVDALHYAYTNLGEANFATGDVDGAFKTLDQAWQIAFRTSTWYEEITLSQEIRWHLSTGNLEAALQRLHHAEVDITQTSHDYRTPLIQLCLAEVLFAMKQYTQALEKIGFVLDDFEKRRNIYFQVRLLVVQALGYHHLGKKNLAIESLKRAILFAAPEGYMRSFLSSDEALILLLHQVRTAGVASDYISRLLGFIEEGVKIKPPHPNTESSLIEPLTEREMEVLTLLAQGLADKKIAESLIIARETVHKHLKNIYEKLGVHSRTEAIARARELGML